jgi:2-polyprenyl-3-methyl-5-hydroxy-6-metoxy-1,4-benzoquinol methylase
MRSRTVTQTNRSSWNRQAGRYQTRASLSYDVVDYGDPNCDTDSELGLIGNAEGQRILEIGCGGANCGIALAKRGAIVTCLDFSSEQLGYAKAHASREGVKIAFIESEMEKVGNLGFHGRFDIVISMCALQYVWDIELVFSHVFDALQAGGKFVFSLDNPIFYSVANEILWKTYPTDQGYFLRGGETWKWENEDDFEFTSYRRPISDYINSLIDTGFCLERFHEMSPKYEELVDEEQKLEQMYPRYMVFLARKP